LGCRYKGCAKGTAGHGLLDMACVTTLAGARGSDDRFEGTAGHGLLDMACVTVLAGARGSDDRFEDEGGGDMDGFERAGDGMLKGYKGPRGMASSRARMEKHLVDTRRVVRQRGTKTRPRGHLVKSEQVVRGGKVCVWCEDEKRGRFKGTLRGEETGGVRVNECGGWMMDARTRVSGDGNGWARQGSD
jgi:hypothetical protein